MLSTPAEEEKMKRKEKTQTAVACSLNRSFDRNKLDPVQKVVMGILVT